MVLSKKFQHANYNENMRVKYVLLLITNLFLGTALVSAAWQLPQFFTDNMVIQRDQPVKIRGWADAGEQIDVRFNGRHARTLANASGNWEVILPPMHYGGPFTLFIKGRTNSVELKNVLIGDVWICSGQSNMEMPLADWGKIKDYESEIAAANYPFIRLLTVEKATSFTPEKDIKGGRWQSCNAATIPNFSAVAYFFGRQLYKELKIPIGLINATWGGTNIQAWTSWDAMQRQPGYEQLDASGFPALEASWEKNRALYQKALERDPGMHEQWFLPQTTTTAWQPVTLPVNFEEPPLGDIDGIVWFRKTVVLTAKQAAQKAVLHLGVMDDYDETYVNGQKAGTTNDWYTARNYSIGEGMLKAGENTIVIKLKDNSGGGGFVSTASDLYFETADGNISLAGEWLFRPAVTTAQFNIKEKGPNTLPSQLYNAMIAPLTPYAMKGVIWYQGEANTAAPDQYRTLFPALIQDWRSKWSSNFPFYWAQLANYRQAVDTPSESKWAMLREAQHNTLSLPATGEAITIDIGEAADIHPKNKQDVGYRLALIALHNTYQKPVQSSGPAFTHMQIKKGKAILSFSNTGKGLEAKGGGPLKGFAIAGKTGGFVWAKATIQNNTVIVESDKVPFPVAVRYAWADNPAGCNLYNKNGLPASPFRTDMPEQQKQLTGYVNPFIGTGAVNGSSLSGNNFPGATVPFGMVQLSPDTREAPDWDMASGYNYNDSVITGFSHTHLSGTGVAELFDMLVMPANESIKLVNNGVANKYHSGFRHQQELARPGYYKVHLATPNIQAEMTATAHAGFHRYTYPSGSKTSLLVDLDHSLNKQAWNTRIIGSQIKLVDERTIEGYRIITGWARMRKVYFRAEFSHPIVQYSISNGNTVYYNTPLVNGNNIRAAFDFNTHGDSILLVKLALSAVSTENARRNLQQEIPAWNFNAIAEAAENLWEKELSKIRITGSDEQKTIFYTALYHAQIQPNIMSDVNGEYTTTDFTTGHSRQNVYSTFSLWDTYRAAHPLYTLLQPEKTAAFVNSLLQHYDSYGYLPIWQLWGQENYCMIGNHAIPVITDAILKNIKGIDAARTYNAVCHSSLIAHPGSPFQLWEQYGYIPENKQSQSVSITLEMAYDDWCVAQLALRLGKQKDYEHFIQRSEYYHNLYNKKTGFFQAKNDSGQWILPFDPLQYGSNGGHPFTEGNAWQYCWYVPHNLPSLIQLHGGDKAFIAKLDTFFRLNDKPLAVNNNASGFIGQYAHGNEPSHHITYLYNYAGEPWKTQYYVSKVRNEQYNTSSAGYPGNEDCGQLSAWYIFSALGFYPVNPAGGIYAIGSPAFEKAALDLPDGKQFIITARNLSADNIYIQSAQLNNKPYTRSYITHQDITKGGHLEFTMGAIPQLKWGTALKDRPANPVLSNSFNTTNQ